MVMIGLKSKSDEVYIVFIDTEEQKPVWIKFKDFQVLWRALKREPNDTKIVFEEPTPSNQLSRCASMDYANGLEICEAIGTIDKDTKFSDVALFVLNEYEYELLDLLTNMIITGKDLSNELDKIKKPNELRVIYEK